MARLLQSLRRVLGLNTSKPAPPAFARSFDTNFSYFREGDRVIINGKNPSLTKPLRHGHKFDTRRGVLPHDSIIGGRVRDVYKSHKGADFRLSLPTLDDYVSMTPRLVTPIYARDANLIVSLLDIHVPRPTEGEQPLEILESGTGHGSLTLHLARAVQAANSNPPPLPAKSQVQYLQDRPLRPYEEGAAGAKTEFQKEKERKSSNAEEAEDDTAQKQWDDWRARRGAVIHTVDVSPKFSAHAEKIVNGFRRGIYAGNVDFYVGPVENWVAEQIKQRRELAPTPGLLSSVLKSDNTPTPEPFLSYAILDMPSSHLRIPHVAPVMKRGGILAVFMPSITQIGDCVELIRRQRLPFVQETVVELGAGISGGREWDVRFTLKKSRADPSSWGPSSDGSEEGAAQEDQESESSSSDEKAADTDAQPETPQEQASKQEESVLVCRPQPGARIVGGGFVGIWRRIEDSRRQ